MSESEHGTIKIPREDFERHNERRKGLGQSWAEYIDGNAPEIRNGAEVDYERLGTLLDERLQYHLAEWEITVNLDQLDLDPVGMDEADVERIVRDKIEQYVHERAREMA